MASDWSVKVPFKKYGPIYVRTVKLKLCVFTLAKWLGAIEFIIIISIYLSVRIVMHVDVKTLVVGLSANVRSCVDDFFPIHTVYFYWTDVESDSVHVWCDCSFCVTFCFFRFISIFIYIFIFLGGWRGGWGGAFDWKQKWQNTDYICKDEKRTRKPQFGDLNGTTSSLLSNLNGSPDQRFRAWGQPQYWNTCTELVGP